MRLKELHKAQMSILRTLRHAESARYTSLMRPTGLDSDVFKFHLRKLVHQKYIDKNESGTYLLTAKGKEFANNLSRIESSVQKQPKLSVAIIAKKKTTKETLYLFQKRLRNPFYGLWGCISEPVQWGESIEYTAKREFEKQTGLLASYNIKSFYRKKDYSKDTSELLEDKLFVVIEAKNIKGKIENNWPRGYNAWMSIDDLEKQDKYFRSSKILIDLSESKNIYSAEDAFYSTVDY